MQRVETAKANTLPHVHSHYMRTTESQGGRSRGREGMSVDRVVGREQMRETLWAVVMNLDLL